MPIAQPVVPILVVPSAALFPHALLDLKLEPGRLDLSAGEWIAEGAVWGIATRRTTGDDDWRTCRALRIFRTIGIGCILHRECEGGSIRRLVLEGMTRARLADDLPVSGTAAVRVEILHDHVNIEGDNRKELAQSFAEMVRMARRLSLLEPHLRDPIRRVLTRHPHPGVVADLLAHHCVKDVYAKQCILAEVDVCRRVKLVQIQLAQMVACPSPRLLRRFR